LAIYNYFTGKIVLVYIENNEKKKNIKIVINNSKKYTKVTENVLQ